MYFKISFDDNFGAVAEQSTPALRAAGSNARNKTYMAYR